MKVSQLFGRTSKTEGTDYTTTSHRLLTQAGYIRESAAGRYYLLPLGIAVRDNVISIIRKHMNAAGGQELLTPTLHPLELWQETNRTSSAGFELMQVKDRREASFALGGTAEEMMVDLVRKFNISYKDLPFNIYQFSLKFRDEMRARGGLLRVREFTMKDAYSFGTEEQFKDVYDQMWQTYSAIFDELGLPTDAVAADNGYIGGEYCHEFISQSEAGESKYFTTEDGSYSAHEDVAQFTVEDQNVTEELQELQEVDAPRGTTMEDGVTLHKMPLWQQTKDVLYYDEVTKRYILALIRGDFDVNETKLMQAAGAWELRHATDEEIRDDLQSEPGFISPVGFPKKGLQTGREVVLVGDRSLRSVRNMYGGNNKLHKDLLNINIDRDYTPDLEADIALAKAGYMAPDGKQKLIEKKGIEVGNIFQLGYHYSNLMHDAEYTNEQGKRQKYYMGCYGIGIERTLAAIVEKHHDDRGIMWPENVAPYQVYLVGLGEEDQVTQTAQQCYEALQKAGVAVLYDDRIGVRAGEKFADADLIGMPYRVVVSAKTLAENQVELKKRGQEDTQLLDQKTVIKMVSHS